jgi:hypothetical protein
VRRHEIGAARIVDLAGATIFDDEVNARPEQRTRKHARLRLAGIEEGLRGGGLRAHDRGDGAHVPNERSGPGAHGDDHGQDGNEHDAADHAYTLNAANLEPTCDAFQANAPRNAVY